MSSVLEPLAGGNTNAFAYRAVGSSLVYEYPNCEFGEVLVTELIESDDARCPDCGMRCRLNIETVA